MKSTFYLKPLRWLYAIVLLLLAQLPADAFTGSEFSGGVSYYLFNIYQSKFLGADCKLQSPNIGAPLAFEATSDGFVLGGTSYKAVKNDYGYYQFVSGDNFFAFEDKQVDPDNPNDENRCMYKGGGVTCQNTTNDTDRSYWQLISQSEYQEWCDKKKITVASLNVDGMPKTISLGVININLNPDATEGPGATLIGKKLKESGFDIVGVSEDFNFHSELWNEAWNDGKGNHYNATKHRGDISVSNANLLNYASKKPLFDMDGLCLFYRINGEGVNVATPSGESWVAWNDHYGYTDHGADGLIEKGYRYNLITLADGTQIDLYTMHMDAETDEGDCKARASQLTQLVEAIKATNNKRPVVIIGDSNCRYTRDVVKTNLIDALNADERFTVRDPWIQFGRNNTYPAYGSNAIMASSEGYRRGEVVDKIWYVNNKESDIRLTAETYAQDLSFVDENGSPLCDHKPCVVTFSYHDYDPVIDDVANIETTSEAVYLRNRATGRYLMNGGWWGSHIVVGNYPKEMYVTSLGNGKYDLASKYGHFTDAGYLDNANKDEYINAFTILEADGYNIFSYNKDGVQKALTADDPTYFNDNPLYRYATTAKLDTHDQYQQWEIVSQEQFAKEMAQATPSNPVNVSHFIKAANFDRIDWNEHGKWTFDYKGNSSRVTDEGIHGPDNDAFCNYNRSVRTKKNLGNSNNQWDCYQQVSVPAGCYQVSCQGFEKGTENTYLYAWSNPDGSYKEEKVKLQSYDDAAGSDQTSAAKAFDKGLFINKLPVIEVGSDGVLVVGVKKTEKNSTEGWMVFDNFQLLYCGPAHSMKLDDDDPEKATKWVLNGTWRQVDMESVEQKLNATPKQLLDATQAKLVDKPQIPVTDATSNMMIMVNSAADVANTDNVLVDGKCANLVVTDKKDFAPVQDFTADKAIYHRTNTQGYNSVCVPFELTAADFPDCVVYKYQSMNETKVRFVEVDANETISAGTPVLVYSNSGDDWTIDVTNRQVAASTSGNATESELVGLNGSFVNRTIGAEYYKLNADGTKFGKTTSNGKVAPFRFYLKAGESAQNVHSLTMEIGDRLPTGIDAIVNERKLQPTFDLMGRRVLTVSRPGIYVRGNKKVIIRK